MSNPIIEVREVHKAFENGLIPALAGATMTVAEGEFVAIVGPSGCGKSTLLHLIAALDEPDTGTITVRGEQVRAHHDAARYRAREIGIIFQLHNLIPTLNASENVQVPMFEMHRGAHERRTRADGLLALVGLAGKERYLPTQLSGGERQRVAVARALANDPPIILADEPTGNLDSQAGERVLNLLERLRREHGLTIVMVTHDAGVAARADRIIEMLDGRVLEDIDHAASPTLAR